MDWIVLLDNTEVENILGLEKRGFGVVESTPNKTSCFSNGSLRISKEILIDRNVLDYVDEFLKCKGEE